MKPGVKSASQALPSLSAATRSSKGTMAFIALRVKMSVARSTATSGFWLPWMAVCTLFIVSV